MRLNPRDRNIANFYWGLGLCHLLLGHVDKAINLLGKARASNPRLWFVQLSLAGALGLRGELEGGESRFGRGNQAQTRDQLAGTVACPIGREAAILSSGRCVKRR